MLDENNKHTFISRKVEMNLMNINFIISQMPSFLTTSIQRPPGNIRDLISEN
jgi:hypothetical protein